MSVSAVASSDELMSIALRGRPRLVIFDCTVESALGLEACERMKRDSYTGVVPAVVICGDGDEALAGAFAVGADEVLPSSVASGIVRCRLDGVLKRSDRDLGVHPSTRLPGAAAIEAEIKRRLGKSEVFAVCYADLDHFKEFNDRYSYNQGDRVIRILAMILHDMVKGICGENGFVGHIGGDDFIFIIPYPSVAETCGEIIATFDALVPYQYSEADRRAGYFFGKDSGEFWTGCH